MAGLEAKLGSLISSVGHLNDSVERLKVATQQDHDKLISLESGQVEWKRTLFNQVEEVGAAADEAMASALAAKAAADKFVTEVKSYAENLVDEFKKELEQKGGVRSDRLFHVLMAIGGLLLSLLGAYATMKMGLSGGGKGSSH